jgi:hypothetical protein
VPAPVLSLVARSVVDAGAAVGAVVGGTTGAAIGANADERRYRRGARERVCYEDDWGKRRCRYR